MGVIYDNVEGKKKYKVGGVTVLTKRIKGLESSAMEIRLNASEFGRGIREKQTTQRQYDDACAVVRETVKRITEQKHEDNTGKSEGEEPARRDRGELLQGDEESQGATYNNLKQVDEPIRDGFFFDSLPNDCSEAQAIRFSNLKEDFGEVFVVYTSIDHVVADMMKLPFAQTSTAEAHDVLDNLNLRMSSHSLLWGHAAAVRIRTMNILVVVCESISLMATRVFLEINGTVDNEDTGQVRTVALVYRR